MTIVLIVLALIVAAGVSLGFYLGWFNLSRNNKRTANFTLSVDEDKIAADKNKVLKKVQSLGDKAVDKVAATIRNIHE